MLSRLLLLGALVGFSTLGWAGSSATVPAGWHTYASTDFGFTISYPAGMKFYAQYGRGDDPDGYAPVCSDTTVACFGYTVHEYPGTNFEGAGFAINVLRDAKSEQQCNTLGSAEYPRPTRPETINGFRFHVGAIGEGGMSHFQGTTVYRAFYQNVCFEIAAQIDTVSVGVFDPGTIKEFDSAKLKGLFDEMVHTFEFVGLVKDGPNWKVSRDTGCGGSFEYPADATLRVTAENFLDRPGSMRITCSRFFTHQGREYTLAVKESVGDETTVDAWLKSSGYPVLRDAREVSKSGPYTEYDVGPYHYIYRQGEIIILSVSDAAGHLISPGDDPVYRHWLASLKV